MVNCINLIIEMSPRFVPGQENVPCVAEVVNRSLKADCTDFNCVQACTDEDEKFGHLGRLIWDALRPPLASHVPEVSRSGAAKIVMRRPVASIPSKRMNVFYYCYYYGLVILSKRKWPCASRRSNSRSCRL